MRSTTVSNFIETLLNPTGRFKTITGFTPHVDLDGNPIYTIKEDVVEFYVTIGGRDYVLKSRLRKDPAKSAYVRSISEYVTVMNHPNLVGYQFFSEEMLVFDDYGRSSYYNVVLMVIPDGKRVDVLIREHCHNENKYAMLKMAQVFGEFALKMISDRKFSHTNIKPSNLMITGDGQLKLLNYRSVKIPSDDCEDCWDSFRNADNVAFAYITLVLYVLAFNPKLYSILGANNSVFMLNQMRTYLVAMVVGDERNQDNEPLMGLANLLHNSPNRIEDNETLAEAISGLIGSQTPVFVDMDNSGIDGGFKGVCANVFDSVGALRESLIAVSLNGKYGYINEDGDEMVELKYDMAGDFQEGLAVVGIGDKQGLINKLGKEILAVIYDDVDWNPDNDVVIVSYRGKWAIAGRTGRFLCEFDYDNIDYFSCDRAVVRVKNKYGYIDRSGELVVPLKFNKALKFGDNGLAEVYYLKNRAFIDVDGEYVNLKD